MTLLVKDLINKMDGFTYWRVYNDITLEPISDHSLANNDYEVVSILGNKNGVICIFVEEVKNNE